MKSWQERSTTKTFDSDHISQSFSWGFTLSAICSKYVHISLAQIRCLDCWRKQRSILNMILNDWEKLKWINMKPTLLIRWEYFILLNLHMVGKSRCYGSQIRSWRNKWISYFTYRISKNVNWEIFCRENLTTHIKIPETTFQFFCICRFTLQNNF